MTAVLIYAAKQAVPLPKIRKSGSPIKRVLQVNKSDVFQLNFLFSNISEFAKSLCPYTQIVDTIQFLNRFFFGENDNLIVLCVWDTNTALIL